MAKLTGILQLQGSVGGLCFVHTREGIIVRAKSSLSRERVRRDPAFARTRENSREFGQVGKAAGLLRRAFFGAAGNALGYKVVNKLVARLYPVMQMDEVSRRGQRSILNGDLRLLEGFEFN